MSEESVEPSIVVTELPTVESSSGTPSPARRQIRIRWVVLGGVALIVLVLAGVLGPVGWRMAHRADVTLSTPNTVAGLTLDSSADARQTTDYLRTAVAAKVTLDSTVGAVYQDPAKPDAKVLFFGGTSGQLSPGQALDQALSLLNDDSGSVTGLHDVAAGTLGGVAKCGTSNGDGGAMPVCGWADTGSLAIGLFPGRTDAGAAALLLDLRAAVEHRA